MTIQCIRSVQKKAKEGRKWCTEISYYPLRSPRHRLFNPEKTLQLSQRGRLNPLVDSNSSHNQRTVTHQTTTTTALKGGTSGPVVVQSLWRIPFNLKQVLTFKKRFCHFTPERRRFATTKHSGCARTEPRHLTWDSLRVMSLKLAFHLQLMVRVSL